MEKVNKPEAYDLKVAWENACDAFAKTSGEELKVKTKYTPEEVLEQIRAKSEKNEEKAAKYRVVKDVLSKTLDCIDNLGNIAAQGASMVSRICFRRETSSLTKIGFWTCWICWERALVSYRYWGQVQVHLQQSC
jgi:hypothetical protein